MVKKRRISFSVFSVRALCALWLTLVLTSNSYSQKLVTHYHYKKLKSEQGPMLKGEKHGTWTYWNSHGQVARIENYEKGKLCCAYIQYYPAVDKEGKELNMRSIDEQKLEAVSTFSQEYKKALAEQNSEQKYPIVKEGKYVNGLKSGEWKIYRNAAPVKIITFTRDTLDGTSTEILDTHDLHTGKRIILRTYKMGVLHGPFVDETWGKNKKIIGQYENGKKEGEWTDAVKLTVEHWHLGKLNGEYIKTLQNGAKETVTYVDGVLNGPFTHIYYEPKPVTKITGTYKNGKLNGTYNVYQDSVLSETWIEVDDLKQGIYYQFHRNGKIKQKGKYKNGKADSCWTNYEENGPRECIKCYENGTMKTANCYYPNGKVKSKGFWNANSLYVTYEYYENGIKRKEIILVNDLKIDKIITNYNEKGKRTRVDTVKAIVVEDAKEIIYDTDIPTPVDIGDEPYDAAVLNDQPEYPGGFTEMAKFIKENIKYPEIEKESGIKGNVFVQFIVERDGKLSGFEIRRGVNKNLDAEAIRVLKLMPKWIPGKLNGKVVRAKFILPINFRLQ